MCHLGICRIGVLQKGSPFFSEAESWGLWCFRLGCSWITLDKSQRVHRCCQIRSNKGRVGASARIVTSGVYYANVLSCCIRPLSLVFFGADFYKYASWLSFWSCCLQNPDLGAQQIRFDLGFLEILNFIIKDDLLITYECLLGMHGVVLSTMSRAQHALIFGAHPSQ